MRRDGPPDSPSPAFSGASGTRGNAAAHAIIAADSASRRGNDPADVTKRACPSTGAPHFPVDGRGFILSASAERRLMQAVSHPA
jgi:hypothetical protein